MITKDTVPRTINFIRNSATIKVASIGFLVALLLIPTSMISGLVRERSSTRDEVIQEISQKWGDRQVITGPFLCVPFESTEIEKNGKSKSRILYVNILPESLQISGQIVPHIRYRSIYEAVLYQTQIDISCRFSLPKPDQLSVPVEKIFFDKATFSIGVTDMSGIKENITIQFNDQIFKGGPGLKTTDIAASGVSCVVPLSPSSLKLDFNTKLSLNGSQELQFIPVGEITSVQLTSEWTSPSFKGAFLPENPTLTDKGFSANWHILHLNRNFPQFWVGNQYQVHGSAFGLKLLVTADVYQKLTRIVKYALMFIIFTFSAFFLSEIIHQKRVHPIQYMLIGFAIVLFYALLLSISEHLNFNLSYALSALAITTIITGYSKAILRSYYFALTVFGIMVTLYGYLYIVLQLADYALVMGCIGLFLILATIMYITRKIDWYSLNEDMKL
ncbi:cell envelope integrity protein CreD [Candidatus Poribacteria bacterium]|nr:cell envelope integrity protein CreD [Candidatus Poribacteria bacterium]